MPNDNPLGLSEKEIKHKLFRPSSEEADYGQFKGAAGVFAKLAAGYRLVHPVTGEPANGGVPETPEFREKMMQAYELSAMRFQILAMRARGKEVNDYEDLAEEVTYGKLFAAMAADRMGL